MALIRCPDCGREVSDAAPACPQCGRPSAQPAPPPLVQPADTPLEAWGCKYPLYGVIVVLLVVVVTGLFQCPE